MGEASSRDARPQPPALQPDRDDDDESPPRKVPVSTDARMSINGRDRAPSFAVGSFMSRSSFAHLGRWFSFHEGMEEDDELHDRIQRAKFRLVLVWLACL